MTHFIDLRQEEENFVTEQTADMAGKRVLVTGVAGLIGAAVVARLNTLGAEVIATDLRAPSDINIPSFYECDIRDGHHLHEIAGDGLDAVVHCGGFSGPMVCQGQPYSMMETNVLGTENVLEIARLHHARTFVYCATANAYGSITDSGSNESRPLQPESYYAASKAAAEALIQGYHFETGMRTVILRLGWVYGRRRTTDCAIRTMLDQALHEHRIVMSFGGGFHRQFIHVDDVVQGIVAALTADELHQQIYNLTGGDWPTLREVAKFVAAEVPGTSVEVKDGPDPLDFSQMQFDISAARRDLGYKPGVSLSAGIHDYRLYLEQQLADA